MPWQVVQWKRNLRRVFQDGPSLLFLTDEVKQRRKGFHLKA